MSGKMRKIYAFKSFVLWSWRLHKLGKWTSIGRCRQVTNPHCLAIGSCTRIGNDWSINDLRPDSLSNPKIFIGDWCLIMDEFQCNASVRVEIGNYVLVASRVLITDSDHVVSPFGEHTTLSNRLISQPVVIEDECWIGQNAVITKGVRIGHHSVIGANSVVTRDVPPMTIVGGVPARKLGTTSDTQITRSDNLETTS